MLGFQKRTGFRSNPKVYMQTWFRILTTYFTKKNEKKFLKFNIKIVNEKINDLLSNTYNIPVAICFNGLKMAR